MEEVDAATIEAFASLFRGRDDSHGRVKECVHEPVTLEHYEKHLKGEVNLGIYFLLDDSTCHFAAIDLDEKDFSKAKAIFDELTRNLIPAYIAESKSKGFHIYCFALLRFKAVEIRRVLNHLLKKLNIKCEVFPKQDSHQPDDPDGTRHPGSYINLPHFGYTRPFLSGDMEEVPLKVALERMKFVPQEAIDQVIQTLPKVKPRTPPQEKAERFDNELAVGKLLENCAFVQHCRDNAITLSEPWWWSMVTILAVFGEAGREAIHKLSQAYPQYTERETEQKIGQALKAGEKELGPHTCLFIERDLGFDCPRDCLAKKLGVASPSGLGAKLVWQVLQYGEPIKEEPEEQAGLPPTPKLPEGVWQGLFRDYRNLVAGTTEASDNYHFVCFAQTLGATLARRIHVYHARRLFPNFYTCLVGRTAITRKDTARYRAQRLLNDLHSEENPEEPQFQILPGIGSAEGLLDALGGERKVVVLSESELLSLLAKARQEALSNLIPKLTSLFDCPDLETLKTRQRTVVCKEPFLSISSGTTLAWLQRALTEKDIYGGFANRFIFVYGNPKPPLPFPPKMDPDAYTALLAKINEIRLWAERLQRSSAGGELTVPDTTKAMFADYYAEYHQRCAAETLPATLIPRVQTFVWKFGLLYAAMAASEQILPEHLAPAILAGDFFEKSILQIFRTFGASHGKEVEEKLLTYLQSRGKGRPTPQREVYRALNLSAAELEQAAKPLERLGLIGNSTRVTVKGRKIFCYEAL